MAQSDLNPEKKEYTPQFLSFANRDLPAFVEVKGKDWIYYGENNDYPYYLVDLYTQSAYHKAIIDGKVSYICGAGWSVKTEGMSMLQSALAQKMLDQPFGIPNLNESTLRWTQDLETFNGLCIVVNWLNNKKSAALDYIDMANVRTNADESEFYYTKHWFKKGRDGTRKINQNPQNEKDWKVYKKYDPSDRTGEQIYYWKAPHPDQAVYPLPVYAGAVTWINVDIDLSKYFFHTVGNAFVATHLINFFNGEPTEEKAQAVETKVKEKWTTPGGSRIIINFAVNKDSAANVETLQMSDADKQYEAVRKYSEQAIFTGHRVTSGMLFGVFREGSLGGRSELQFAEEHFQNAYITPRQNILENIINELAKDFGITVEFYLNRVRRVGYQFSDAVIEAALTPDEKRRGVLEHFGWKESKLVATNPSAELLSKLSGASPLLATKIIDNLTPEEVRSMVGLGPKGAITTTQKTTEFASEKPNPIDVAEMFERVGHDGSKYELISESPVEKFDRESVQIAETEFLAMQFAEDIRASQLERTVTDLLLKDSTMQPEAIAEIAKVPVSKIESVLKILLDRGIIDLIKEIENTGAKGHEVTEKGKKILDEKPAKTEKYAVVYRYGLAPKFVGEPELLDTSHEFCIRIIGLSKSGTRWTSEDIFSLDNGVEGMNAWTNHGGWYTIPSTDEHIPTCRHTWIRQLVKIKD